MASTESQAEASPSRSAGTAHEDGRALMDAIYRHQRHIYDLTRKYYLLGRDRLIDELAPPAGGSVLEIGCGTGRNLIAAARRYPDADYYGIDIAPVMLETAQQSIDKAGLSDRVRLGQGDAAAFSTADLFDRTTFDRVFFSYSLSMIPPWEQAIENGLTHLAPDGTLMLVDFGMQRRLPSWFRALLKRWLAAFHVAPRADLEAAMHRVAEKAGASAGLTSLYRDYAVLGHITRT